MGLVQVELGPARKAAELLDAPKALTPGSGAPGRRHARKRPFGTCTVYEAQEQGICYECHAGY